MGPRTLAEARPDGNHGRTATCYAAPLMRRLLPLLLLAACGPSPAPPAAPPAPVVSASASASTSAPRFDPSRKDAPLLELLAALPDPGPLDGGLNETSRQDLKRLLGTASEEQKREVLSMPDAHRTVNALVLLALRPDDVLAIEQLCCRGQAWKSLQHLRSQGGTGADDLVAGTRRLVTWAARAYARQASRPGRPPVTAAEADRLVEVSFALASPPLERAASALAVDLDPTPPRLSAAVRGAARMLDPVAARRYLEALQKLPTPYLSPWGLASLETDIANAEALLALGGPQAPADRAPQAAALATRLGRLDLLPALLDRAGPPEKDLRVALASAALKGEGAFCLGLEWTEEPQQICGIAWRQNPDRQDALALLDRAKKNGVTKDPWALEAHLGFTQILPMTHTFAGGNFSTPEEFIAVLGKHRDEIRGALEVEGVPGHQREAIPLFTETLYQAAAAAIRAQGAGWSIEEGVAKRMMDQASTLLEHHPGEAQARQAALAVAMFLFRNRDTGPLLRKIAEDPQLIPTRARVSAFVGLLRGHKDLVAEGLRALESSPGWLAPQHRARNQLLALELRAAQAPDPANLEALLAHVAAPFPEKSEPLDQLQRLTEQVGVLARLGRRAEIEQVIERQLRTIEADPQDSSTTDLLAVLQTVAEAQMATSPDPVEQRKGMGRLREHVTSPEKGLAEVIQLYRVRVLHELLEQGRSYCVTSERACRGGLKELREQVKSEQKRLEGLVMPELRSWLDRGILLAGSNAKMHFGYSPRGGLSLVLDHTPRILQVPPTNALPVGARPR